MRSVLAEAWHISLWLLLRASAVIIRLIRGESAGTEREIIHLGDRLFKQEYPESLFDDYESYVQGYPSDLAPYLDLAPKEEWLTGKTVLDIGCGLGQYSVLLKAAGALRVDSIDSQENKVEWALAKGFVPPGCGKVGDARELPYPDSSFDTVFSHTAFEHVEGVPRALSEVWRVLKHGGCALIGYNFFQHRGGHHLFPYVHFPWAPWVVKEKELCRYWSERLAEAHEHGRMGYFTRGASLTSLSDGEELHLNRLNYDEFEAAIGEAGLRVLKRMPSESLAFLAHLLPPGTSLRYFLTGSVYYLLGKEPRGA